MKNTLIVTILLTFISFVSTILYFMATTDIYHDYVGKNVSGNLVGNLPDWTNCRGEWQILQIDFGIRIIFMILVTILLIMMIFKNDKQKVQYR